MGILKRKFFITGIIFFLLSVFLYGANQYKIIVSDDASGKLDINRAVKEEMLRSGVAESYVNKIISFRDIKGGIESISELSRISGIGEKTCEKLEKYFTVKDVPPLKDLYINKASDKTLSYYGFDKKEIKRIRKYLDENGKIENNIVLKKVLSDRKYEKYKDVIKYDVM